MTHLEEESMPQAITTINLWAANFILSRFGGVNCYLVQTDTGFILIDTGFPSQRAALVKALERAGCQPGNLRLIILTHGDADHAGNGAYLRKKYRAPIAIHRSESKAVASGDMALNRKNKPEILGRLALFFLSFVRQSHFHPDVSVEDGGDLSRYGFAAHVLHLPGHSKGSIGILTTHGDLFCGDLLWNRDKPAPYVPIDDLADVRTSIPRDAQRDTLFKEKNEQSLS
jgi:hydroxyacylglutathione hydrolase